MISIKKIDLLDIKILENNVYYKDSLLILKTSVLTAINCSQNSENFIKLTIDTNISNQNRLKETILFINRNYPDTQFIEEHCFLYVKLDSDSKFFDSRGTKITKNSLNRESKIICSIFIKNGIIYLHQCMKCDSF